MSDKEEEAPPTPQDFTAVKGGKLNCNMDGYVLMTLEITKLMFVLVQWVQETYVAVLPTNLGLSLKYLNQFLYGIGAWIGYATAAVYFFGDEFGVGDVICDLSGYGYEVIDGLQVLVTFTEDPENQDDDSAN